MERRKMEARKKTTKKTTAPSNRFVFILAIYFLNDSVDVTHSKPSCPHKHTIPVIRFIMDTRFETYLKHSCTLLELLVIPMGFAIKKTQTFHD